MPESSDGAGFVRPSDTFGVASDVRTASAMPLDVTLVPPDTGVEVLTTALGELAHFATDLQTSFAVQCGVAANAVDQGVIDTLSADAVSEDA